MYLVLFYVIITNEAPVTILQAYISLSRHTRKGVLMRRNIYRWLPCERPLCVGPLNFWEFGKFSRNFIWSCFYKSPCCVVICNAAFVLFSPTLYSGKLAHIWSSTAGFDVITYALVKKIFPLLCLPDFLETFIVFFFAWWDPWARSKRVAIAHLQLYNL